MVVVWDITSCGVMIPEYSAVAFEGLAIKIKYRL